MFSQVSAFISDLKHGFKSSGKGPSKTRRRPGKTSAADDDSQAQYGCLGRSVSMEWGLASRRRRTKSMENLDRMSDHVRSAVSLMELTQATQARPVQNGGTASSMTTDTWSSSNSSSGGHTSSSNSQRNRRQRSQDETNRAPPGVGGQYQLSRDQQLQRLGSTPNRRNASSSNGRLATASSTSSAAAAAAAQSPQAYIPPPPRLTPKENGSSSRRPNSTSVAPTTFNSVPRTRPRRRDDLPPHGWRPPPGSWSQGHRKDAAGEDAVDGVVNSPGVDNVSTPNGRPPEGQTNGRIPMPRRILPPSYGMHPAATGSAPRPRPEAEVVYRSEDAVAVQPEMMECVIDSFNGTAYYKGKLLGKGGFAKCYELTDMQSLKSYAGKIIARSRLNKDNQKEKILREVELHRGLAHRNVVKFHSYFEDETNVYIVLEYCSRKSLVHVLKHRKTLTEPEVRYYMHSLVNGLSYVHSQCVIHRDLKLGNMLLNENMELKIADFGLATRVEYEGEKKMTVCGTPNYIAPEVLQKKGHSYEADIWALGCIMYAMLCGRPPFETATLKETYMRIVTNKFVLPAHVSLSARDLICKLLTLEPMKRPPLCTVQGQDFFSDGHFPTVLCPSTCETRPKFPVSNIMPIRKPRNYTRSSTVSDENNGTSNLAQSKGSKKSASQIITRNKTSDFDYADSKFPDGYPPEGGSAPSMPRDNLSAERLNAQLPDSEARLYKLLLQNIEAANQSNKRRPETGVNGQGSLLASSRYKTSICVTKWVDYSNKYGFGFQLSNAFIGILFNDNTRMLLAPDGLTIEMCDPEGVVQTFDPDSAPEEHQKKVTLLLYFAQYMDTHLISGGQLQTRVRSTPVFMKKWFRTDRAIVMFLTDGTLQVNFLEDHTKVILNPDGSQDFLLTVVNSSRQATTYPLKSLRHLGCSPEVLDRLRYACNMLERTINIEGERV